MSSQQQPLIIKDWTGIAESPHKGFGLFRNADLQSFPGAVKVNKKPGTYFHTITTRTFTADDATDICTASGVLETNNLNLGGAAVYFTTTGTLPAGLSLNTIYFLIQSSSTTFKVATSYKNAVGTAAGTAIDITGSGSGTHTINQVPIGTVNWIIEDPRTNTVFMLSSNGRVWFTSGSRTYLLHNSAIDTGASAVTNASGQGIAISPFSSTTSTYLFVFRNALIDVIDVFGTTAIEALAWSNAWKTMNTGAGSGNSHHAIKAQDDVIYFCDDRYVGSIKENSGSTFDPANAATYTFNNQALDLPAYEISQCFEEQGTDLLIGGNTFNNIYPWDRISNSFNLPLPVPEFAIKRMKNIGGLVFILAGTWGNIYTTQGTYVKWFAKLPNYLTNNAGSLVSNPITWGGIYAISGDLLFGVATTTSGNSGVWRLKQDGTLTIDNMPSSGSANVIGLWGKNEFYLMGYSGGADNFNSLVSSNILYDNLETVIHSALFKVATKLGKGKFSRMEVVLAKPATAGSVKVSYRADLSSSFTTIDTFTADSATTIFTNESVGITDIDNIQIQIEMNDGTGGSVDMELLEIRLFP